MPERPEVTAAKEKLAALLPAATRALEDLLDSPSQGARLGAAKDILDRGGVPIHTAVDTSVDISLDSQILQLMGKLARARDVAYRGSDSILAGDGEVQLLEPTLFDDLTLQPVPELMAANNDNEVVDGEIMPDTIDPWWQAN